MTAIDKIKAIQTTLGVSPDGIFGTKSHAALSSLIAEAANDPGASSVQDGAILRGDGSWPYTARIDGNDIVCEDITITCFGGLGNGTIADPQDSGDTASGVNTKDSPISGVSIAMDGRAFPHLTAAEHRALDGSPFPRMPWGTPVEVTIGGVSYTPEAGVIDLGPGKQASSPGDPHALDLTVMAASFFRPTVPLHRLATRFSARGSFRIKGGARFVA